MKTKDIEYFEHMGWLVLERISSTKFVPFVWGSYQGTHVFRTRDEARAFIKEQYGTFKIISVSIIGDYK